LKIKEKMFESLEKVKKRLMILFAFIGVFILCLFGLLNIFFDKKVLGVLEIAIGISVLISVLIFKNDYKFLYRGAIILTIVLLILYWLLFITGGFKKQGIFWIYTFPLITFFLKERKEAIIWNLIFIGGIILFQILDFIGIIRIAYPFLTTFEALSAYILLVFLTYFYANTLTSLLEMLRDKVVYDSLTGIYSRDFILAYLEKEVERVLEKKEKTLNIVFIDLDNFKQINDTYGHVKGDEILSKIGKILREKFRSSDIVGRFGGDEFLIVIRDFYKKALEEKIIQIKNFIEEELRDFNLSLSYGIVSIPFETNDFKKAIKIADKRMYEMKKQKDL
jgi:diguanylate cyclase (GGDEF)-like protein